jgi:phosphoketolase
MTTQTLEPELLHKMDAYWRAANYLSVGQIYLYENPLLKRPLELSDVKPFVVGHWGTTPGQNFIYVHLNRVITRYDLNMLYVAGPGHGVSARAVAHPVEVIEYPACGRSIVCRPNRSQQLCWRESTVAATVHFASRRGCAW